MPQLWYKLIILLHIVFSCHPLWTGWCSVIWRLMWPACSLHLRDHLTKIPSIDWTQQSRRWEWQKMVSSSKRKTSAIASCGAMAEWQGGINAIKAAVRTSLPLQNSMPPWRSHRLRSSGNHSFSQRGNHVCANYSTWLKDSVYFKRTLLEYIKTDEQIALSATMAKAIKEILLRLPAESTIQSKLTCKQWLGSINNESFIHHTLDIRTWTEGRRSCLWPSALDNRSSVLLP